MYFSLYLYGSMSIYRFLVIIWMKSNKYSGTGTFIYYI